MRAEEDERDDLKSKIEKVEEQVKDVEKTVKEIILKRRRTKVGDKKEPEAPPGE